MNRLTTHCPECLHCGGHVSERFARVFGDDADRVHRCQACDSMPRLSRGNAAGKPVPNRIDPEDDQDRQHGTRTRATGGVAQ
ncbi:DUF7563 family protein [Halobaculum roseum]|uniref:Small CPxCG-related zinc finger protein n=1 Tax=Halobaculum roseum TaxID=2175149 RepID=A0ABD5MLL1_9EURY|nr:hypothetical protein [Halobaculum roseum]QZY04242.1 hypothetical protein K6T36_16145 [Halobaculum roseum]